MQTASPACGTKNFSSVRLYSAPQLHCTIVAIPGIWVLDRPFSSPELMHSARRFPPLSCAGFDIVRAAVERLPANRNGAAMRHVRKVPSRDIIHRADQKKSRLAARTMQRFAAENPYHDPDMMADATELERRALEAIKLHLPELLDEEKPAKSP